MRIARISYQEESFYAEERPEGYVRLAGDIYGACEPVGAPLPRDSVRLLCPCEPNKIICVGKNFFEHVEEMGGPIPEEPILFIKTRETAIGPDEAIVYPSFATRVDYEGELAMVVKKRARNVKAADFRDYLLGFTCLNDVTERDLQKKDKQWTRAKGFDTFAPIGPVVTDEIDPFDTTIETFLNGERRQHGNTSQMHWSAAYIFEYITAFTTLCPGDVVACGTPAGIGPLRRGDVVEVRLSGIGTLRSRVE